MDFTENNIFSPNLYRQKQKNRYFNIKKNYNNYNINKKKNNDDYIEIIQSNTNSYSSYKQPNNYFASFHNNSNVKYKIYGEKRESEIKNIVKPPQPIEINTNKLKNYLSNNINKDQNYSLPLEIPKKREQARSPRNSQIQTKKRALFNKYFARLNTISYKQNRITENDNNDNINNKNNNIYNDNKFLITANEVTHSKIIFNIDNNDNNENKDKNDKNNNNKCLEELLKDGITNDSGVLTIELKSNKKSENKKYSKENQYNNKIPIYKVDDSYNLLSILEIQQNNYKIEEKEREIEVEEKGRIDEKERENEVEEKGEMDKIEEEEEEVKKIERNIDQEIGLKEEEEKEDKNTEDYFAFKCLDFLGIKEDDNLGEMITNQELMLYKNYTSSNESINQLIQNENESIENISNTEITINEIINSMLNEIQTLQFNDLESDFSQYNSVQIIVDEESNEIHGAQSVESSIDSDKISIILDKEVQNMEDYKSEIIDLSYSNIYKENDELINPDEINYSL